MPGMSAASVRWRRWRRRCRAEVRWTGAVPSRHAATERVTPSRPRRGAFNLPFIRPGQGRGRGEGTRGEPPLLRGQPRMAPTAYTIVNTSVLAACLQWHHDNGALTDKRCEAIPVEEITRHPSSMVIPSCV